MNKKIKNRLDIKRKKTKILLPEKLLFEITREDNLKKQMRKELSELEKN